MVENDKDLIPMEVDFSKARSAEGRLDEGWYLMFGALLRWIMPSLYRGTLLPLKIKGSDDEVRSFANVLSREKNYLTSWKDNGLDNPVTYQNRTKLDNAVGKFERTTGLKWPFKS
jgi:hypothetical protein